MRPFLSYLCKPLACCALTASLLSPLTAATIIDANFNSGTFADAGLVDYSTLANPTLTAGIGVGGSTGLNFGTNGGSATASMTILTTASFSMFGQFTVNANGSTATRIDGSAMAFGWTKASEAFRPFQGTVSGSSAVAITDTVMVGLARTATGGFSLGFGNGATELVSRNLFGNSVTFGELTANNWYRLEGTIQYNSSTGTFTFLDVSLDDFGTNGTTEVNANLLYGTGGSLSVAGFGSTGRAIWANNLDRGVLSMDNYYLAAVPEPAAALLLGVGGFAILLRRRRSRV
ncbi:PEP-CTERM sorting domain-containing protein [Phragmitibacter flavus]|uniref:PEP-CTERM sorting domain-containing protein n=1 Tax=Phragmitibacter flavus TaxID=2576071 RepID=A0A5R8KKY4_9BACT|nr:PEP-CTERM sorting domain-containing protein [Phragmitibacter flavus]TLD72645.1 PEP-CTERM sorting domain-containing protein [Phragmitibacter flavus]